MEQASEKVGLKCIRLCYISMGALDYDLKVPELVSNQIGDILWVI